MSRPSTEQLRLWQDLQQFAAGSLDSDDVEFLHVVLSEYWAGRDTNRFVLCLLSALDSPEKLSFLGYFRQLLYEDDVRLFDKVAPVVPAKAMQGGSEENQGDVGPTARRGHTSRSSPEEDSRADKDRARSQSREGGDRLLGEQHGGLVLSSGLDEAESRANRSAPRRLSRAGSEPSSVNVLTLTLQRPSDTDSRLGLRICGGAEVKTGVFVSSVTVDSPAERSGFRVGDRLLTVGEIDVSQATNAAAATAIRGVYDVEQLPVVLRRTIPADAQTEHRLSPPRVESPPALPRIKARASYEFATSSAQPKQTPR